MKLCRSDRNGLYAEFFGFFRMNHYLIGMLLVSMRLTLRFRVLLIPA